MRRTVAVLATVGLLAGAVTGCSASEEEYCKTVKESGVAEQVRKLDYGDPDAVKKVEAKVGDIADTAPEEIRSDWKQIAKGIRVSGKLMQGAGQEDAKVRSGVVTLKKMGKSKRSVSKDVKERCDNKLELF